MYHNIGIRHGFSCINIRQVPWEVLKTEKLKMLATFCIILHHFVSPFHRCRANAISTYYACSRAGQYTSRDSSNSVARFEHIESCVAVH